MPASQDSIANETGELPSATENFRRGDYIAGRLNREPKAKRCIAQRVARLVKNNQSVLLDAGSTIEMVADELFREREYLAVLTNNLGAYARYADAKRRPKDANDDRTMSVLDNELHLTGGRYHETYESLLGPNTLDGIKTFVPNVIVIGVSGIKCGEGVFCHGIDETAVKELLWTKTTDLRIIAADWTKIGFRDTYSFGRVERMGFDADEALLVTTQPEASVGVEDRRRFDDQIKEIRDKNITVIFADEPT